VHVTIAKVTSIIYKNKMARVNKKRLPVDCIAINDAALTAFQVFFFPNNMMNQAEHKLQGCAH